MVIDVDFMGRVNAANRPVSRSVQCVAQMKPRLAQNAVQAKDTGRRFPPASTPVAQRGVQRVVHSAMKDDIERYKADLEAALKAISAANSEIDRLNVEIARMSKENKDLVVERESLERTISELKAQKSQSGASKRRKKQEQKTEEPAPIPDQSV